MNKELDTGFPCQGMTLYFSLWEHIGRSIFMNNSSIPIAVCVTGGN